MTLLTSALTWAMQRPKSLPSIIVEVGVSDLPPLAVKGGGDNAVTLPLLSAGDKCSIKSDAHVAAALVLVISHVFKTSAGIEF